MLKDTQKMADVLDTDINDATQAYNNCKEGPSDIEAAKKGYYLRGLLRAQEIFLNNVKLPY